jgi:poly-gamma-glutamate synthase PgsB/CapB
MNQMINSISLAVRPYLSYFLSPTGNLIFSLMLFAFLISVFFIARHWLAFRRIENDRKRVPLVIGGWGTRGKSGTERLKAALFTSLGYKVLAKTTGSAAMFLRNVPGEAPMEIFLFRPYDKASIWEQSRMLSLAAKGGAQVFLWECMALNKRYVDILQHQWMKDDVATITNAYADHEDIQGPAGLDVATVIASFIPDRSKAFTTEVQMLPVLMQSAKRRKTELVAVPDRDAQFLPSQLMSRFPYEEHPSNIALIARLAEEMGIDREQALFEMADRVVPEIGVLKVFPEALVSGRRIQFVNGMSANERMGFLNNWRRTGFDTIGLDETSAHWAVTFVNNRADRVSRSQVFARILVEDIFAHRIVLVGTNLRGMRGYIHDALNVFTDRQYLIDNAAFIADQEAELQRAVLRLAAMRTKNRLAVNANAAIAQMVNLLNKRDSHFFGEVDLGGLDELCSNWRLVAQRKTLSELEQYIFNSGELRQMVGKEGHLFLAEHAARHLIIDELDDRLEAAQREPLNLGQSFVSTINKIYAKRIKELFWRSLLTIPDALVKADTAIRIIAQSGPPGYKLSIIGMQNIKGPGLDMVYRWQAYETIMKELNRLDHPDQAERLDAVTRLHAFEDYGLLDSDLAHRKVEEILEKRDAPWEPLRPSLEKLHNMLHHIIVERKAALSPARQFNPIRWVVNQIESMTDFVNSISRRRQADQIYKDLITGRISQKRAALELRSLTQRQKGGWLRMAALKRRR